MPPTLYRLGNESQVQFRLIRVCPGPPAVKLGACCQPEEIYQAKCSGGAVDAVRKSC